MIFTKNVCLATIFLFSFSVCNVATAQRSHPKKATDVLNMLIKKGPAESGLELLSYEKKDILSSKADINAIIDTLFSDKYFYLPVYNKQVTELDVLTKGQVLNSFHPEGTQNYVEMLRESITPYLQKSLKEGDLVYQLNWKLKGEKFSTLALISPYHFIYEHMLANIMKVSTKQTHKIRPNTHLVNWK